MKTILMVCTANQCRSPMAEGLMRHKLEREKKANVRAASAGAWAVDGRPASEGAVQVMAERGINIKGHRSRDITPEIVQEAALILTMARSHADAIKADFPAYRNRVYLLSEMAGNRYDIDDPIGGTLEDYERTAQEIQDLIERGYPQMMKLIGEQ